MRLQITCDDRLGITQDVLDILVGYEIDLRGIEIDPVGKIYLHFPSIDFSDFQDLMPKIRRIPGVEDVRTAPALPIERERNQLGAVLNTLPEPVFSIDPKGFILLANDVTSSIIGHEKQKSGISLEELENFYNECSKNMGLNIVGLMCLPPKFDEPIKFFKKMLDLKNELNLSELSMGMSDDFIDAAKTNSTFLRIGSKIFGARK